ncbi:hypothetical protein CROQUDRAFT_650841 [Cronartium quercuum f. sp. fusiforme G11]|uniref:Mannosyltransferase n=1 Tax=Cronartium quercuum f. sp. fusiforme G11 TaxID=708437 RepID=A0A9P6NWP9_9BASI|nr:hypothetical protein CROQUDRAFT_650841 [Cronartium quercuum f. sp. fusiforme G11]
MFFFTFFVFLRILVLLSSTSYLHPDEHFQSSQIAIADVFHLPPQFSPRTWEWHIDPDLNWHAGPLRSILPLAITSHLPLVLLRFALRLRSNNLPTTYWLVVAPRLLLFFLSLLSDCFLLRYRLFTPALILASSPVTLVFLTRPFANSLETILFAPVFFISLTILNARPKPSKVWLAIWTFLNVLAGWARVTFVGFGLPAALMIGWTHLRRSTSASLIVAFTGLLTLAGLLAVDSSYFERWPSIPPLSLLLYNLEPRHLALHGLHPRWLHVLVNGPLLFGPALWILTGYGLWIRFGSPATRNSYTARDTPAFTLSVAATVSALGLLSTQPHQEPRFIMSLSLPITIIGSHSLPLLSPRSRKLFWIFHFTHAFLATLFYGYAHQAGLQPALGHIQARLAQSTGLRNVVSWKTFDLPSALLFPTRPIQVTNLGSASENRLLEVVCASQEEVLLVAPTGIDIVERIGVLEWRWAGVHVDPDRILEGRWGLGVWSIGQCEDIA